jgi:hypothetical protein
MQVFFAGHAAVAKIEITDETGMLSMMNGRRPSINVFCPSFRN